MPTANTLRNRHCTLLTESHPKQPPIPRNPSHIPPAPYVVGYSQYALTNANQFVSISFKNVGKDVIDLTSIKVVGYTGTSQDKASVQIILPNGKTATYSAGVYKTYYWRDDGVTQKWIRKNGRTVIDIKEGDVTLAVGDALWCQKTVDGLSFQFSGEVIKDKVEVALPNSNQAVGNMMAIPVDLTKIKVEGYTGTTSDKVSIQLITAAGKTATYSAGVYKTYYWRDDGTTKKWIRKNGRTVIDIKEGDVVFAPGDGMWVQNTATTVPYKLVFSAPEF